MGALVAITPTNTGILSTGAAVAASDTIARSVCGPKGAYLEIVNGNASSDVITITDAGSTPSGNALSGGTIGDTITTATSQIYYIHPEQFDPVTNLVTITHSVTTTVTYKLYPVGA